MQATTSKYLLPAIIALLSPTLCVAAETNATSTGGYNVLLLTLVSLIVILLFMIGVLGNTLRQLSMAVKDKLRKDRTGGGKAAAIAWMILAATLAGYSSHAADGAAAAAPAAASIEGIAIEDFYMIITFIVLELVVIFALVTHIHVLLRIIRNSPELEAKAKELASKNWFWDKFNKAASIEKEQDILLDHNYDGIQELDNSLPPWWIYGFYLTIIVGVIYVYRFHVSHTGLSQEEEYITAMEQGEADKLAYLAKSANNVDESNVVLLTAPADLAKGRELYSKNCVACHLADGGGSVGPNLVDDYWIHGGSIKDVFKTLKYGWQEKGMKSWKDDFPPRDLQAIASYIKSIKGNPVAVAKAPQGDLYVEAGQAAAATDSTKTDSTNTTK